MSHPTVTWVIAPTSAAGIPAVGPEAPVTPVDFVVSLDARLGSGLTHPFRRDGKGDWAHVSGRAMIQTHVSQILGTKSDSEFSSGEMPWRQAFGSRLHLLKHAPINSSTPSLARLYCVEAVQRWEPRVRITDVSVLEEIIDTGTKLTIGARFDFVDLSSARIIHQGIESSVVI